MAAAFLWGGIGVLILFILIGFLAGLIRGLKRSALHIIFFVVSFVIAFFITKPITSAVLGISITVDGTPTTLNNIIFTFLNKQFNLSQYQAVGDFAKTLPLSVVSPIMFIIVSLLTYFVFDIIYLIVARLCFGKKKKDFAEKKPLRWYGSAVGAVEGFLFLFLLFAPLTSLTQTYESLATYNAQQTSTAAIVLSQEEGQNKLPLLPEVVQDYVPSTVDQAIKEFNKSVVGKVSGAGGLNHALFDYLSSTKVNKETIHLRKDLLALANTYNEFAVAYNSFTAEDFENLDLSALKTNLEKFLNEGLFKGVVAPTVQEFVVKFNVENAPDVIKNSELVCNLITELQTVFKAENFVAKTYLKDDLLKLVDIAKAVADSGLVAEFKNLQSADVMEILKTISENTEKMETVLKNVADLHILNDGFDVIGDYASQKLSEFFDDENIKLNLNPTLDKMTLITDTYEALSEALEATKQLDFSKILAGDLMGGIAGVENIDQVLINIGKAFDKIRNLDILVYEKEPETGEPQVSHSQANEPQNADGTDDKTVKTYVLDEILKKYHFALVTGYTEEGNEEVKFDTVHATLDNEDGTIKEEQLTINTYENFCKAIARPVKIAQKLDLFHIGTPDVEFETILGNILDALHEQKPTVKNEQPGEASAAETTDKNTELLSHILLPFFELQHETFSNEGEEITIRNFIFKNIIDNLNNSVTQIDLSAAISAADYDTWKTTLDSMAETLLVLDDRENTIRVQTVDEETKDYTYIMYLVSDKVKKDEDKMKTLLNNVVEDKTLKGILTQLLKATAFEKFVDDIFVQLDNTVAELTKESPEAMQDRKTLISGKEEQIAQTFEKLVTFANANTNLNEINLAEIGELLDSLKDGAKEEGIFKGVFENLIWYLTGDSAKLTFYAGKETTFEQASTIKNYLAAEDYYAVNYAEVFAELQDVEDFANSLQTKNLKSLQIEGSNKEQIEQEVDTFLNTFDEILKDMERNGKDAAAQAKVIENVTKYKAASNDQTEFLTAEQKGNSILTGAIKEKVKAKYNTEDTDSALTTAILSMLGLAE